MNRFLQRQWFLIALALVLLVGFLASDAFRAIVEMRALRNGILFSVLFLMALPVKTVELGSALRTPWAAIYASLINFALVPILAWLSGFWFDPFLGDGIVVAAVVPCTLASATVWTRRAGGNDSVAIFVTLFTNLFCFVLTPFWIWLTLGRETDIDVIPLIWKLALLVVLPMILAQLIRQHSAIGEFTFSRRTELSTLAQIGILMMVLIGAAKMGIKLSDGSVSFSWQQIAGVLVAVNAIHLAALYFGKYSAALLGFSRANQIAIGIAGSQKTLMVGLNTAVDLNRSILPMLLFHICQLLLDTVIADRWREEPGEGEDTPETDKKRDCP